MGRMGAKTPSPLTKSFAVGSCALPPDATLARLVDDEEFVDAAGA